MFFLYVKSLTFSLRNLHTKRHHRKNDDKDDDIDDFDDERKDFVFTVVVYS